MVAKKALPREHESTQARRKNSCSRNVSALAFTAARFPYDVKRDALRARIESTNKRP